MAIVNRKKKKRRIDAKPISELVGGVLEPALAKRTGMTTELIAAWPVIVGEGLAQFTQPEKISWPRRVSDDDPFEAAVLILACDGSRAIFVQHEADQIIAKINVFFGFDAIRAVKIVQKPVAKSVPLEVPQKNDGEVDMRKLDQLLENVGDEDLRERLVRLGKHIVRK